ncbi:HopJ type III effector protein [Marinomonas ostreistagni]|uniref:HopJ type III effector protein n=1 Tax=Marinomonas ostreistagni TaxID=359209 RepID=UPI00194FB840|nr:HopJ type III effector protein [Marinomonas ostreistagni]MBM6551959.1 HopJ type III effector protein [Marinomonas ostreistagni]
MLTTQSLLQQLTQAPETVTFQDTIAVIDNEYEFTPSAFKNGEQSNQANENNGSCKILSFAQLHHLSEAQTPHLFGDFYRKDVLEHPEGTDHQNIRQFLIHGWDGVKFEQTALVAK